MTPSQTIRFWAKVNRTGACWEWTARRNSDGYGCFWLSHHHAQYAHRVMWTLAYGPVPDGLWVLHRCDNPPCCRPDHLFLGTHADNVADAVSKGRHHAPRRTSPYLRGEQHHKAKLMAAQVLQLRALYSDGASYRTLARQFNVSKTTIERIVTRRYWTHV